MSGDGDAMDTQITQPRRPGLKLSLESTGSGPESDCMITTDGDGGMIKLIGGDAIDLSASFHATDKTLRLNHHGIVIKESGIQEQPAGRRLSALQSQPLTAASSSSSSSTSPSPSSPPHFSFNALDLVDLRPVGKGACGVVRCAFHIPSLSRVALKTISNIYDAEKRKQFIAELAALTALHSPYIVPVLGAAYNEGSVTIALAYANRHSLLDVLKAHGPLHERMLQRIALHTMRGLDAMHHARCIHRDIKPGNILITSNADCMLTDFGVAKALEGTLDLAKTFVGTTVFMAPERVSADGRYSTPSDIWSVGVSLCYLASGKLPYSTEGGYFSIVRSIRDDPPPTLPPRHPTTGESFSAPFREFLSLTLNKDPNHRPTAFQLLQHPFLSHAEDAWRTNPVQHPIMEVTPDDESDLTAILRTLYAQHYAPGVGEYRRSLFDLSRLQRLAQQINIPRLTMKDVQTRFEKIYEQSRKMAQQQTQ